MSFIAKNPLSLPEIKHTPSTPSGTRGLFAKKDGFYEVDTSGKANKYTRDIDVKNSYKYYGDAGIVPSAQSFFYFETDASTKTATIKLFTNETDLTNLDIVVPYEYKLDNGEVYTVTKIGTGAFSDPNCIDIASLRLPNTIVEIETDAFNTYGDWLLKSFEFPDSITIIGARVFLNQSSLTDIYFKGSKEQWDNINIDPMNEELLSATIHYDWVPATEGYVNSKIAGLSTPVQAYVNILGAAENPSAWKVENVTDASGNVIGVRYGQVVNVNNAEITCNSKVDLQIDSEQMVIFYEKDLAFVAENEDGVVTIYCIGQIPQNDYRIQATVTEVV